jgi:hypothetical protein
MWGLWVEIPGQVNHLLHAQSLKHDRAMGNCLHLHQWVVVFGFSAIIVIDCFMITWPQ